MKGAWVLAALLLAPCVARAEDDPMAFLRPDISVGCVTPAPAGLISYRRHDWGPVGAALGYGASDNCVWGTDAVVNTSQFSGDGKTWDWTKGDGAQIIQVVRWEIAWHPGYLNRVLFWMTQDGSSATPYWVTGGNCGDGSGWLLFEGSADGSPSVLDTAATGWFSEVANLAYDRAGGWACPPMVPSYTRWMRGPMALPVEVGGKLIGSVLGDVILTEHFDNGDPSQATAMEQNIFARGYGLVSWRSIVRGSPPAGKDLAARCPALSVNGYPAVPPGWVLSDCRYWMNYVPAPAGFSVNGSYRWPWWSPI